jgi:rubrerythrin
MDPDRLVITDGEATTEQVREYEATRRDLVRRGVLFGGLTVAAASTSGFLKVGRAFGQANGDAAILESAIGLEQTAVFAYDAAARSGELQRPVARVANLLGDQEQEHADALITALGDLGGRPPAKPTHPDEVEGLSRAVAGGQRAILEFAVGLEESAVAAYYMAQQKLKDAKLLQTGASIMSNEGQHLVVLRQALERNAVPNAFETGQA